MMSFGSLTVIILVFAGLLLLGRNQKLTTQPNLLFVVCRQTRRHETEQTQLTNSKLKACLLFTCTLTGSHFEEDGHVIEFNSNISVMDGVETSSSPKN